MTGKWNSCCGMNKNVFNVVGHSDIVWFYRRVGINRPTVLVVACDFSASRFLGCHRSTQKEMIC